MKQVVAKQFGGPDVLNLTDAAAPSPAPGEVVVALEAAAVNRVDLLLRSGTYHSGGTPPLVLGREGAGVVIYPLGEVAEAHRRMEANDHFGKLLVAPAR